MLPKIQLNLNENTFTKNPDSSELGLKIVGGSIILIDDIGFERFTFKKLGVAINSTEASIYRYFESKHQLLIYLTNWYWAWQEYRLYFVTANVESAEERLRRSLCILTEMVSPDGNFDHIDEKKLQRIVIAESIKAYFNKKVDADNENGAFGGYKNIVAFVSGIITQIAPGYPYPRMLVSTVVEGANCQRFFATHLPNLTNVVAGEDSVVLFYNHMVFGTLQQHLSSI